MAAGSAGSIDLDLGIDYNGFQRQLGGIAGTATNMVGGAFKKLGGLVAGAFAIHGLVSFGKAAINLASDLQEVQNVVDVTFGAMAADVNAFSKEALNQFGLSELSAKKYSSTMGAMLKSSGLTGSAIRDMSLDLTGLSADMASFYNLSTDMAFEKIRAGISGETEPLRQLGINMSVANLEAYALSQGITKSYQAMNQAEQTLLRYNYLLSATSDAQGDFVRTGDSWANQTRLMGEQWKIFQGTMGQGFINILTPVVKWINTLIQRLQVAAQYFKAFTEVIFGAQKATADGSAAAAGAASSMGDMGGAASDVAKDVKKAGKAVKGSLGGFDQLNTITQSTAGSMADIAADAMSMGGIDMGSASTGDLPAPDIDTSVMQTKVQGLVDWMRGAFDGLWGGIKSGWSIAVTTFGPSLTTAWAAIAIELENWKLSFGTVFSDILTLGEPLKNWVINDLVPYWQLGIEIIGHVISGLSESMRIAFEDIWAAVFPIIDKFVTEGLPRMTEFATGVLEVFQGLFDLAKQIFDDIWSGAVDPAMQLVSTIIQDTLDIIFGFWDTWGKDIVEGVKTALNGIKELWNSLWDGFLKPFVDNMLKMLTWLWDKHLKGLVEEIANFVGKLTDAALDIFNEFILPIVNYLVDKLGPTFSNIFSFIGDFVGTIVGTISDILKGLIKSLGGVVDFIAGAFTGDWERAWNGIKTFFQGIGDAIKGIFKGVVNGIIDLINFMVRQINKVKIDIPDWVPGIGGKEFGMKIPELPKLAQGGLAYGPTLAMVGDNKKASTDPEVISPLSKLQEMMSGSNSELVAVMLKVLEAIRNQPAPSFKVGENEFGRLVSQAYNTVQRQAGYSLMEG